MLNDFDGFILSLVEAAETRVPFEERKKEYYAGWYQKNKKQQNLYYSEYREKIRKEMIAAYGGCCRECGEDDFIVLVLDHIENDSKFDRETHNHSGGHKLYQQLRKHGWPRQGYQLLCCNCNFRKEYRRRKDAVKERCAS